MEFNKSVSNPMLMGAIELMKAEDTPEHRNMFIGELAKASFLSPAIIEPAPTQGAEGKLVLSPGSKVQFPMITGAEGMRFFMAFTDMAEYEKWQEKNPQQKLPYFALKIEDYAAMVLRRDSKGNICPALGITVNPYGANIIVPREMLAGMMSAKAAAARQAGKKGKK